VRNLRADTTWRLRLALPARAAAALRAGRDLRGEVVVRERLRTAYGVIPEAAGAYLLVRG